MRYLLFTFLVFLFSCTTSCKEEQLSEPKEKELTVLEELEQIANISDEKERTEATEEFWNQFKEENEIPYTKDSLAIFFYYGKAQTVSWNGDFNSWSQDQKFKNDGTQIKDTKLWYWPVTFPKDARLDYKITIDENNWILDPENPHQQWSGFGPNSELQMPEYQEEPMLTADENIAKGSLETYHIFSDRLQYGVNYKVYLPADYESLENLPCIYVTDGHEYSDEKLGNMITVLDNLIGNEEISPIMAVFIDPRDPNNPNLNRRQDEYTINNDYLDFAVHELIPAVDQEYKTSGNASDRAILGTSLGGLNSSYFAAEGNNYFKKIAIQSPAYWYRANQIYELVNQAEHSDTKVFMTAGTFNDGLENAEKMQEIYKNKGIEMKTMTVNEGHSWGAWSAQLDDILVYFYGKN